VHTIGIATLPVSPGGPTIPLTPTPIQSISSSHNTTDEVTGSTAPAGHTPHSNVTSPMRQANHWAGRSEESKKALVCNHIS
jgi:hypothetical protein